MQDSSKKILIFQSGRNSDLTSKIRSREVVPNLKQVTILT
ncbi:hypothetical protein LEP1GSC082_2226 [Leptospira kirschneri str. H2]|uniref:Uncharacterized protein n=1 Tax=Leptospira kirschneri str. H1 TaxID=1049966 RepID=A0A0E2B9N2_9LEPT|nr:hypothetical protein LEP1GSC081_3029 [Leptospira kirschneri str. H1]EKO59531.1 hypothetical protein LEP1GSC082_2226 [Leptospira kirschneri str. H2]